VRGLEAVDGSPIVDIKPFSKSYHGAEEVRVPAWMEQIRRELEEAGGDH
jgi:tRNA (Thr-GGU) A37 N-methylase